MTLATGFTVHAPYCITKAALNQAISKYAVGLRDEGFIFLAISPGLVNTSEKPRECSALTHSVNCQGLIVDVYVIFVSFSLATPEELKFFEDTFPKFKKLVPEWDGNPITPETSVRLMLGIIDKVTVKDTGAFVSHWGNQQWL